MQTNLPLNSGEDCHAILIAKERDLVPMDMPFRDFSENGMSLPYGLCAFCHVFVHFRKTLVQLQRHQIYLLQLLDCSLHLDASV